MKIVNVLIADHIEARLYRLEGGSLSLIEERHAEAGRTRDQDIEADKPQRTFDRHGAGRFAHDRHRSGQDKAAKHFAGELATLLRERREKSDDVRFVLAAEPRFLGLLRAELDDLTSSRVTATSSKDLIHSPPGDLLGALEGVL